MNLPNTSAERLYTNILSTHYVRARQYDAAQEYALSKQEMAVYREFVAYGEKEFAARAAGLVEYAVTNAQSILGGESVPEVAKYMDAHPAPPLTVKAEPELVDVETRWILGAPENEGELFDAPPITEPEKPAPKRRSRAKPKKES